MNATSCKVTVLRQSTVAADIRCLTVQWPDAGRPAKAGQFFMLRAWAANETPILSRPISVHDFDAATGALTFLYQVKGEGTQKLAALKEGDTLTVTGPCGNGFDVAAIARAAGGKNGKIAVVGGGIGTAPLLQLCKELAASRNCTAASVMSPMGWKISCLTAPPSALQRIPARWVTTAW